MPLCFKDTVNSRKHIRA